MPHHKQKFADTQVNYSNGDKVMTIQEKIQQLREKLELQKQQVEVLSDLWYTLFPSPIHKIDPGQFLTWLRKYEFDHVVASFESGADWLSTEMQKIEEGAEDALPQPPGKINLIKIVSKNMVNRKVISEVKAKRAK
jgi:hypothetical protein